jgi:hypothetical protein
MRQVIKKHSSGNEYLLTRQNKWVRNYTLNNVPYLDLNNTIEYKDHHRFLENEIQNNL